VRAALGDECGRERRGIRGREAQQVGPGPEEQRTRLGCVGIGVARDHDVAVRELAVAHDEFDARRDATGKLYRYSLWNAPDRAPLRRRRSLCLQRPLDLARIRVAAAQLVGSHDFASFQAAGSQVKSSVRTLRRLDVTGGAGSAVDLWFEGSGFLRHMVRNLSGTLIEVGSGRRDPEGMTALLAARDRQRAGPTAPPHGLTLVSVSYPDGLRSPSARCAKLADRSC